MWVFTLLVVQFHIVCFVISCEGIHTGSNILSLINSMLVQFMKDFQQNLKYRLQREKEVTRTEIQNPKVNFNLSIASPNMLTYNRVT